MFRPVVSFWLLLLMMVSPLRGEDWISLFNGKDLEGWTPKIRGHALGENVGETFRVEDGLLKVRYDTYDQFDGQFGHLFYKDSFSHYRLRIEYRFVGEQCPGGEGWALRNSGAMLHGQQPEQMKLDQRFPDSIEVQLLGGNGQDKRPTANLCTPGNTRGHRWKAVHDPLPEQLESNLSRRSVGHRRN